MVETQIEARGVAAPRVLAAIRTVESNGTALCRPAAQAQAYADHPLPIGHQQTISQPYIVALMTELVRPGPDTKVLEIGTGSGYQAAVLAECAGEVYTIEIVPEPLGSRAAAETAGPKSRLRKRPHANRRRLRRLARRRPRSTPLSSPRRRTRIPNRCSTSWPSAAAWSSPSARGFQQLVLVTRTEEGFERARHARSLRSDDGQSAARSRRGRSSTGGRTPPRL